MRRHISENEEAAITAALTRYPHTSAIARASNVAWSYSPCGRIAERAGIELTAGRINGAASLITQAARGSYQRPLRSPDARKSRLRGAPGLAAQPYGASRPEVTGVTRQICQRPDPHANDDLATLDQNTDRGFHDLKILPRSWMGETISHLQERSMRCGDAGRWSSDASRPPA